MKKIMLIVTLTLIFILEGCISFGGCHDDIEGRYFSERKSENVINFLDLNKDGAYYHYYKEGSIEVYGSGKWKKVDDPYCKIRLDNWKNFNIKGLDFESLPGTLLYINGEYLDRTPDGNDLDSFKKEK